MSSTRNIVNANFTRSSATWCLFLAALALVSDWGCSTTKAQGPAGVSGELRNCSKCGRYWIEQEEPFILYSEQSTSVEAYRSQFGSGLSPQSQPLLRNHFGPALAPMSFQQAGQTDANVRRMAHETPGLPNAKLPQPEPPAPFVPQRIEPLVANTPHPEQWLKDGVEDRAIDGPATDGEWYDAIVADPDDGPERLSFRTDISRGWQRVTSDLAGVMQPNNLMLLAVAAGGAIAIHQDVDDQVRASTLKHPQRWGRADDVLQQFGEVSVQLPVLGGFYLWSLKAQNEELHDIVTTTMSAYAINSASTMLLKWAVNTDRPTQNVSHGHYGFPSFHTSSTFTIASVLNEYYGWQVGVPAYVVAGMVGWSRIDQRDHDVSDVLFGAALGYVIGTSVARHHLTGDSRVILLPWNEPSNRAVGLACEWHF